jgi:hypothetical protein
MRALWLAAGLCAVSVLASGAARAECAGKTVLFQDKFDNLDPSWGSPAADTKVENGRLVVAPSAKTYRWLTSSAGVYDDAVICATVTTVAAVDPETTLAGIVFWYQDNANFYVFEIAANGHASVWRQQRGRWIAPVSWQDAAGLNKGDGAVNELQVVTADNLASFSVNGKAFTQTRGQPPRNGQQVGVFVASFADAQPTYAFDDFIVAEAPEAPAKAAKSKDGASQ